LQHRIQLIVGLGNPGDEYTSTRHNAGAWLVTKLAEQYHVVLQRENKFQALLGTMNESDLECKLLLPTTYMNLSGQAVVACAHFYKIPTESILIVHDELDFPPGTTRFKCGGGHGGHNGLRNIVERLGNGNFCRLRIGIGHPGDKQQVTNYVLAKPNRDDKAKMMTAIENACNIVPELIKGNIDVAIRALHDSQEHVK